VADDENTTTHAGRVLVVDDDRLVLATLATGLRQAGLEVIEADNGDDAILLARKSRPELAILDMRMQGKSGLDVARYLAAHSDTAFMFLSAFGDDETVAAATQAGALGYLVKPLDVRQIVPAVQAGLARAREQRLLKLTTGSRVVPNSANREAVPPVINDGDSFKVGVAVGILMARHCVTETQARRMLADLATTRRQDATAAALALTAAHELLDQAQGPAH
jgi:two-component system, response regulator PdtaR